MNNEKELVRPGGLTSVSSGSGKQIKKQRNVITRICALAAVGVFLGTGAGVQATTTQAINNVTDNDAGPTLSINGNIATSVAEAQALDSSVTALNYADQNIIMGEGSFVANQNFDDDGKSVVIGASSFVSTKPFGTFVSSGGTAGYNAGGQGVVVGSSSVATSQAVAVGGNVYAVGRSSIALGSDDNQAYKNTITQYDYENYFKNLYKYIDADGHTYGYYSGDASVTNKENTASRIYSPTLAQGNGSISIGSRSLAYADGTTALGTLAFALGQGSTAVGTQTRAQGVGSIAIGSKSYVFTDNSIAAGNRTQITGDGSAAYGYRAAAVGDNSLAIGTKVYANANIGFTSTLTDAYNITVNSNGTASGVGSNLEKAATSILNGEAFKGNTGGYLSYLDSVMTDANEANLYTPTYRNNFNGFTTSDGILANATSSSGGTAINGIAIGSNAMAKGTNAFALGRDTAAVADNSQSIGAYSLAYGLNSTAVGVAAHSLGKNSLAVGVATSSVGNNSTTVGAGSVNYGSDSAIFGATSDVWQTSRNVALFGVNSTVKGANILALGNNIRVVDGAANGVATNDTDLYSSTNTNTKDIVAAGNQVAVGMDAPKDPTNTTPGVPASNDTSSSGNGGSTTTVTGPAGHDGTNGTTMTNKIQALRDGTAGTLVYTDGNGNRLLSEGGKYYNTALVSGKVKANNGLWYNSADVNSDGSLVDPTNTNGQTLAQLNEAATTSQSVDPSKVVLSAVNPDGTTTAPTAIKNVASVLGINPTGTGDDTDTVTNLNSNPIGEAKAQTLTNNLLGMSGAALNQVTTAADLQAVAQAGLDFTGNMNSASSTAATDVTVHRALGSTLKIIGADTTANGLASTASSYSAKNLATIVDTTNNTIQVVMKKVPDFDAIHIGSGTITIEAGSDNGNTLTLRQYDPSTGQPINNAIAINGLTTGDDASSIATKGYVDGLMGNGATSVPSSGSAGDLGPASQDNMANNGIINQLDGIRSGLAGTMVYTDKAGDRLIHQNGNFYKASAFAGRRYLTADNADLNGKPAGWYNTSDMTYDSATSKWKFNTGTTPTALSDADIAAAKVATNDIVISSVHPDGSTTTTTPIYNVQSALGINPAGTTNAATDLNNAAITSDKAKTLINGDNATTPTAGSLLGKSGTALNQVTTVGDLQAVAQAGLDFTGNLNVNNSTTDGATMTHQALGSALNIIGAADSAHGLLTSTNSYDASNLATVVDPTNHQVQVVMKKAPTFSGLKVGDASFTFTKDPNTDTWTIKPYDVATNTTGSNQVSIDGMTTGSTPSSLVTKDYVDKLIGGGSSTNNGGSDNSGSGTNGASGNDGQNGNSLVNKVQSLRDGTSGTMVYTDKAGDRLLAENGLYYKPALVDGLKQGIDGRWYPADDLDSNGIPKSGTESDGKTLKELNDAATTKQDVPVNTVVMSAVNPDGTTKTPTTIRNVASVLGIDPTGTGDDTDTVTNLNSEPIGQAKAQTLTNNLLSMKGDDLTQAVTAGDLQAVAQAGLDFGTNQGGTIHRALGSTLSIKGAEDNTNSANFDASNVMTWADGNVIRIGTTKTPKFDSIQFNGNGQNGSNPVTMTTDGNGNIIVKNGSEQVRLATMNDGIYVADGNNNTKLVKLGEKVTFNKNMDVSFSDATTANASNTGTTNGSTSGSTSSGSSDTGSATSGSTATTGTTTAPSDARATVNVSSTPTFDSVTVNKAVDSNSAGNTLVTKTYVDTNVKTVSDAINNISNSLGKGTIGTGNDTDNGTVSGATVKNYLDANYATRGEMNGRLSEISNDSSAGTAAALAAATIPQITNLQQGKVLIGAGMGGYRGQSALAVGVSGVLNNRDVTYKLAGTFDSQNHWGWSAGIGIAVGTGGDVPSVTEGTTTVVDTKTLSTINDKMAKLEAENKAIKEKNEALQKRMDEILAKLSAK